MIEQFARESKLSASFDKHLADLLGRNMPKLTKSIPASDPGTSPAAVTQRGTPNPASTSTGAGPLFASLISAGAILDGAAVNPDTAMHFERHVGELAGSKPAQFGKRKPTPSGTQSASYEQSRSASDEHVKLVQMIDKEIRRQLGA